MTPPPFVLTPGLQPPRPLAVVYAPGVTMNEPRLIHPPAAVEPFTALRGAAAPDAVVPGGPVYRLPPWWPSWLRPNPVPIPKPVTPPPPPVVPQPPHGDAQAVVDALNAERGRRHLAPLAYDAQLSGVAQYWSGWQALHRTMTHGPGTSFATRIWSVRPGTWVAENVAEGYPDVASVVAGWMGSPGHRANILGDYTAVGVGIAPSSDGTLFWTTDFCR